MQADIRHFEVNCQLRNERILASIECINEGNPFSGTLILTNFRLGFIRSRRVGKQSHFIRFRSIQRISTHVEDSFRSIFVVELPSTQQRFELKGPSFAMKRDFVELVQHHLLTKAESEEDIPARNVRKKSNSSGDYAE